MEEKKEKILNLKKFYNSQTDIDVYFRDTKFNMEHVLDGVDVWQLGGIHLGFFETFELMVENLVIDGYKFVDIIEELEY